MLFHLLGLGRQTKRVLQLAADLVVLVVAFCGAVLLKLESVSALGDLWSWAAFASVLPATLFLLHRLGLYRSVVRHTAGDACTKTLAGAALSAGLLGAAIALLDPQIEGTLPVIYGVLAFLGLGGARFGFREVVARGRHSKTVPVIIFGAGESGRKLAQMLREGSLYRPVAFVDDDERTQKTLVAGLSVVSPDRLEQVARTTGASAVILAMPSVAATRRGQILARLEQTSMTLLTVPAAEEIVAGRARLRILPDISVQDILGRIPLLAAGPVPSSDISGKVVLVTSASGAIGRALCDEILACRPKRLVVVDPSRADLALVESELIQRRGDDNPCEITATALVLHAGDQLNTIMQRFAVDTVFHIPEPKLSGPAAGDLVDMVRSVVFGTRSALQSALAMRVARFVLVSSDKAGRPVTMMAAAQRLAEMFCLSNTRGPRSATQISILRVATPVQETTSLFHLFRRQIESGGAMTVAHPQMARNFALPSEVARTILQSLPLARTGDVLSIEAGASCNIVDLAIRFARLHGLRAVVHSADDCKPLRPGEVAIRLTGLRPGEPVSEARALVGLAGQASEPRITSVGEGAMPLSDHAALFDRLASVCAENDVYALEQVLMAAQSGDHTAPETRVQAAALPPSARSRQDAFVVPREGDRPRAVLHG